MVAVRSKKKFRESLETSAAKNASPTLSARDPIDRAAMLADTSGKWHRNFRFPEREACQTAIEREKGENRVCR
jgi:hypothetical protein